MKFPFILDLGMLERLTKNPDYDNIIVGTGAFACDMRDKLRQLGLKVPFMIGSFSDAENNIRHYSEISRLENPKQYRFIICCDEEEWELIAPALSAVYRLVGNAVFNHPQVFRLNTDIVLWERGGKYVTDAGNGNVSLRNEVPYIAYGDESDADAFHVHILGSCHAGGIISFAQANFPEILWHRLNQSGFRAVVYTWGQINSPVSDCLLGFVRDICFRKADLAILYTSTSNSLQFTVTNALPARTGLVNKHIFTRHLDHVYKEKICNGVNFNADSLTIRKLQQRVLISLSQLHRFAFWEIIPPTVYVLPDEQAKTFRGASPGYLSRRRLEKDRMIAALDKKHTKDYSDAFNGVDDIFSMFADAAHLTSEGNRLVAERCAADILGVFSNPGRTKQYG